MKYEYKQNETEEAEDYRRKTHWMFSFDDVSQCYAMVME